MRFGEIRKAIEQEFFTRKLDNTEVVHFSENDPRSIIVCVKGNLWRLLSSARCWEAYFFGGCPHHHPFHLSEKARENRAPYYCEDTLAELIKKLDIKVSEARATK